MIPYEELVAALQSWRSRQGLPTAATDYLGEAGAADYSIMNAVAAEEVEEISEFDVADEVEVSAYDDQGYAEASYEGEQAYTAEAGYDGEQGYAEASYEGEQGYAAEADGDDHAGTEQPVEYPPAEIDAMRAEYAADAFGDEQETAYSPVQSDDEVAEQALDYSADYDDGATVIGGDEPVAAADPGIDAPVPAEDLGMDSFAPTFGSEAAPGYQDPAAEDADDALGAAPAAEDEALPAYGAAADYSEGTVDVDLEMSSADVIESALPPPPPAGGFDEDDEEATSIAASSEPPPLAPPPEEPAGDSEFDSFDVIDEEDDPNRGPE